MRDLRTLIGGLALCTATAVTASGQLLSFCFCGSAQGGNPFPFGVAPIASPHTVYQQVYWSAMWSGIGPVLIDEIDFFTHDPGLTALNSGTFDIFLSTSSASVNALNTSDFDANRGPDNTLFGSFVLGGPSPPVLAFKGTPYLYIADRGNLLIDIRSSITSSGNSFFYANNGDANGLYSRAHNYSGTDFEGFGLDTRFIGVVTTSPEPSSILLVATGLVGFAAVYRWRRRTPA